MKTHPIINVAIRIMLIPQIAMTIMSWLLSINFGAAVLMIGAVMSIVSVVVGGLV